MKNFALLPVSALAALAMTITASAGFRNRAASSGVMTMTGEFWGNSGPPWYTDDHGNASVTATLPSDWATSNSGWNVQDYNAQAYEPRLIFNAWQENVVSAISAGGPNGQGGVYPIFWTIPSLQLGFSVTTDDTVEIVTQSQGVFSARLEYEWQGSTVIVDSWTNLGATKVFNLIAGYNYRFHLTNAFGSTNDTMFGMNLSGVAAPAPGALALLGLAGVFGGRRRR